MLGASKGRRTAAFTVAALAAAVPAAWAPPADAQPQKEPLRALRQGTGDEVDIVVTPGRAEARQHGTPRGLSAERLLHRPVHGRDGEEIGDLKDMHIGHDGRIEAIVVELGGVVGIGGHSVPVPWREVTVTEAGRVVVDATEAGLAASEEKPKPGPEAFKASELIGSYTLLAGGAAYGRIADVVFERDGAVAAVLVEPRYGLRERYGYPADDEPPLDFEAIGVQEYEEVEVDPATGELVIERETGGDKEQTGNLSGIRIDPVDR